MVKSTKFTRALAHVHNVTSEPVADLSRFVGRNVKRAGKGIADLREQILEDHEEQEAQRQARRDLDEQAEALAEEMIRAEAQKKVAAKKAAASKPKRQASTA